MSQQQIIVQPLGLITQPNKLGTFPPGAMQSAEGWYIRDPNILEVAPAVSSSYTASPPSTLSAGPVYLFAGPPDVPTVGTQYTLLLFTTSGGTPRYSWQSSGGTNNGLTNFADLAGNNQVLSAVGQISSFNARGRQFVNATKAVMAFDHAAGANPTPRNAIGIPPVCTASASGIGGVGPPVAAGNMMHYSATIRRVFADGYELVSAPSAATCLYASGGVDLGVFIYVSTRYHQAGDIIDLYRTRSQPQVSATNTGADYYLAVSYTLTSADIAATNFLLRDFCGDDTLGDALYTNPGAQGEAAAALPPPQCKVMANFKGHAFYLNCVDPAKIILRIGTFLGYMGDSATGAGVVVRTKGIGTRLISATTTSGSPTITAVTAGDIVGIKVGQTVASARFAGNSVVTAVGATTITVNNNASASGAAHPIFFSDVIEVDGNLCSLGSAENFCTLPVAGGGSGTNQAAFVVQALDRILPDVPGGSTNPFTTYAEGLLISRWFLADGHSASLTLRATNGANYSPQLPEITATVMTIAQTARPNGMSWSEQNQPERVCALSTSTAGQQEVYAAFSTRDALWIFASDGLWRLSGTGGNAGEGYDWRIDPVDSTLSISGPLAGCVLRDTVFAYTNRGFVSIDSSGNIKELSQGRLNDILPGPPWSLPTLSSTVAMWMIADETHDEILFTSNLTLNTVSYVYVYNLLNDTFTRLVCSSTFGTINITGAASNYPPHAAYVRQGESVIFADRSSTSVLVLTAGTWGPYGCLTQPVYVDNPFNLRHWQNASFVFQDFNNIQFVTVNINGTLTIPNVGNTSFGNSGHSRVSCSIPRNSPAIANQIAIGIQGTGGNSSQRRLFAIELDYVELTEQRRKR